MVFVIRPLGVFWSTSKSGLQLNEKLFISWVGPRGIVAAGIASLFGLKLAMKGEPGAEYITPLVFMIVLGTVLLNATTARFFAKVVGVFLKSPDGILIVGASPFSRIVAQYLIKNNRRVVLIDSNVSHVRKSKMEGIEAFEANVFEDDLDEYVELSNIRYLFAFTGSASINDFTIQKFSKRYGEKGSFRLISEEEMKKDVKVTQTGIFSKTDDFLNLSEVARDFPLTNEVIINSKEHYYSLLNELNKETQSIPVFLKDNDGRIHIIADLNNTVKIEQGNTLVYIGKKLY